MSAARISEGNTTLNNKILMVMPWRAYVRKATEEGFRVFSIWDPERIPDDHREEVARYSEELLFTDFRDVAGLRRLVAGTAIRLGVAHVLHLGNEDTQLPVCEEAHAHGLALNPPEALRVINDKTAMRQLLRERGLSPVRATAAASAHEVRSLLSRLELPVVAKPALLSGSRGVRLVHEARDLDEWEEQLADQRYTGPVLIEEYLRGPEFSVETLTAQGTHHLVGITSKRKTPPPGFTEIAHVHPASLTEPDRAAVADLVVRFLDEAGYRFGPAHTEVILTADGPRIVESQTRAPGDRIHRAIALASGYDIEAAMFRALAGKPVQVNTAHRVGCVSFFQLPPGRLVSVEGLDDIRALPFVHELKFPFAPGDTVPEIKNSGSRHGHVVIDAASEEEVDRRIALVRSLLRATTDAGLSDGSGDTPQARAGLG
ncbi:ATP-grasp domain-containing protein (plasmid) [Streptomyces sp. NBC_01260]|nr:MULTISPECIES: ATP-grasp domain-containing protein [unclassified Streptomyces]MCX4775171.1 ATP-grasp domain-containing protein [Streptomyces sp. NBC_01285]RPK32902.1 Alanine-anticapsin ligase BacD [Streptomyces sp. ADI92-24]